MKNSPVVDVDDVESVVDVESVDVGASATQKSVM